MAIIFHPNKLHLRLFVFISAIFLLFVVLFVWFQYQREKTYKVDILHSRLQTYNRELYETLHDTFPFSETMLKAYIDSHPLEHLRVSVIKSEGTVIFDSQQDVRQLHNHLNRKEIREALQKGQGHYIQRKSEYNGERYFYSATYFPLSKYVIRSAVPYSAELTASLKADYTFVYVSILVYLILCIVLFVYTRALGNHITETIDAYRGQVRQAEQDKVRIKQQLTQNTAHELKTPAASVLGYLETLLSHPEMSADKRQCFIERSFSQAQRMTALLRDMGTLTWLDEKVNVSANNLHEPPIDMPQINLCEIMRNVLDDTELAIQEKGILLSSHIPEELLVKGNSSLFYSVFRNVIDNAIAYSGATLISISIKDNPIEITIADNGVGVAAEHLPHLFERFYRIDKGRSRDMGGTGLGLAIVKNAVAYHGGIVLAETAAPYGLMIRIVLPNDL